MDVIYKAGSLLYTHLSSILRVAAELPYYLVANATQKQQHLEPHSGCTYYAGKVTHIRRRPVKNSFKYRVCMVLIDLDQPPPWFMQQQAADHMSAHEARDLAQCNGKVLLLTNPVVAGYVQNPISVYYCYNSQGQLHIAIAEVTNTPWGERVTFLFDPAGDVGPKALHVSPFMNMQNTWHIQATAPDSNKDVSVFVKVDHPKLGSYFDAHLTLRRCPDEQQCAPEVGGFGRLFRYGFMPQRVAFWIYWQAVRLIAKGCPIYSKPGNSYRKAVSSTLQLCKRGAGAPYVWRDAQQWPWYL